MIFCWGWRGCTDFLECEWDLDNFSKAPLGFVYYGCAENPEHCTGISSDCAFWEEKMWACWRSPANHLGDYRHRIYKSWKNPHIPLLWFVFVCALPCLSFLCLAETVTWRTGEWKNEKSEQKTGVYRGLGTITFSIGRLKLKCICRLIVFAFLVSARVRDLGGLLETSLEYFMRGKVLNWQKKKKNRIDAIMPARHV